MEYDWNVIVGMLCMERCCEFVSMNVKFGGLKGKIISKNLVLLCGKCKESVNYF